MVGACLNCRSMFEFPNSFSTPRTRSLSHRHGHGRLICQNGRIWSFSQSLWRWLSCLMLWKKVFFGCYDVMFIYHALQTVLTRILFSNPLRPAISLIHTSICIYMHTCLPTKYNLFVAWVHHFALCKSRNAHLAKSDCIQTGVRTVHCSLSCLNMHASMCSYE